MFVIGGTGMIGVNDRGNCHNVRLFLINKECHLPSIRRGPHILLKEPDSFCRVNCMRIWFSRETYLMRFSLSKGGDWWCIVIVVLWFVLIIWKTYREIRWDIKYASGFVRLKCSFRGEYSLRRNCLSKSTIWESNSHEELSSCVFHHQKE